MTEPAPDPPAAAAAASPPDAELVAHEPRCTACAYLLHGLPIGGACPECGQPVEESLRAYHAAETCPAWIADLTLAAGTCMDGLKTIGVAATLYALAAVLAASSVTVGGLAAISGLVLLIIGGSLWLIGATSLTTRSSDARLTASAERARVAARRACGAALLCLPFLVVTCGVPELMALILAAAALCGLLWLAFHSLYIGRLAETWNWTDVRRSATRSRLSITVLLLSMLAAALLAAAPHIPLSGAVLHQILDAARAAASVLAWVSATAAAVLGVLAFVRLHVLFRRRLHELGATPAAAGKG